MLRGLAGQFSIVFVPAHRYYRDLLLAWLISTVGTWTAFFAVRIALYQQTNSPIWITALLFSELAPGVILGITAGPLIDRWPRQRMLILSDLGGVAAFSALPFVHSPAVICAVCAFAGLAAAFFRPGCYSAIPNLIDDDSLMAGNALMQGAENIATLVGPVLAAVGVITIGAHGVYGLNALSFLISALLLVRIGNRLHSDAPPSARTKHWREVRAGFSLVRDNRYLSSIFLIWSWATLAYTGINVAEIVLAKSQTQVYGTGSLGFGIFVAASALGALVGTVAAKGFMERLGMYGAYRASFLVTAAGVVVCALSPGLAIGCAGAVAYGVGNGVGLVCNITLIQKMVPDERRGQIFAVLGSLVRTFTLVGTLAAGPIIVAIGPRLTWGASAALLTVGYVNAVAVTSLSARRERRAGTGTPPARTVSPTSNGHARATPIERIGSLLDEIDRTREAEEARGFVTRSRRHHMRSSRRRRRG
jgi:MFS family permease